MGMAGGGGGGGGTEGSSQEEAASGRERGKGGRMVSKGLHGVSEDEEQ